MKHSTWILCALMTACGGSGTTNTQPPADTGLPPTDAVSNNDTGPVGDAPRADVPRTDGGTPTDLGVSRAGSACATAADCNGLDCDTDYAGGFCTAMCDNNASQTNEQSQCGGRNSTCLSIGDGADAYTECTRTCTTTARTEATGACRAGQVCTGWWYTHDTGEPDTTGCQPYCQTDAQCLTGEHCNTRLGECGDALDMTRRADGEPCDPTVTVMVPGATDPQNIQCRGVCFQTTDNARDGVCGSFLNLSVSTACPDSPTRIHAEAPASSDGYSDNLGLCIFKECTTNADCTAPLQCIPGTGGAPAVCDHGMGIPADAGTPDASTADASATDATAASDGGSAPTDAAAGGG